MYDIKFSKKIYDMLKEYFIPVLIVFGIYIFGIYPILRANFNYMDDMGRVFAGYRGWSNFSRYSSSLLSIFLHTDTYLTDISPLPQLLAIFLLSITVILVFRIVTEKKRFSVFEYTIAIFLGLNPYFLECLSYKYDAFYMALSVFVSFIPFLYIKKRNIVFFSVTVFMILVCCTIYQVSLGIYPMFLLFISFKKWEKKKI